jgi:hypothetical protein
VATLMRRMGIEALYRKPNTSKKHPTTRSIRTCCASSRSTGQPGLGERHHVRPNGLRLGLPVCHRRLGQPQSPLAPGVDQHGRLVLRRGARGGIRQYGKPEIFNSDQGSQLGFKESSQQV